jgi:hypothetical protein
MGMKDRTAYLDGGRLIDYPHYIDTDTLPDRAAVRRELDEAFALEDERLDELPDIMLDVVGKPPEAPPGTPMPAFRSRIQSSRKPDSDFARESLRPTRRDPLAEVLGALRPNPFPALITTLVERNRIRTYAELCEIAGISKQLFHQLMDHRSEAIPKRENVFRLAFALKAPVEDVDRLLEAKGLAFRKSARSDVIVRHCFASGIFDPMKVDRLLFENGCSTLFSEE